MFQKMIVSFVISFVLRQLLKFQTRIDWAKVEKDLDERIRRLVPGTFLDDEISKFIVSILHIIRGVIGDEKSLKTILTLLSEGKFAESFDAIKRLILGTFSVKTLDKDSVKSQIYEALVQW